MSDQIVSSQSSPDRISTELSSRRTGMSLQRTRLSADRTLMSVIRTSLSLISFGFTIYQVFKSMSASDMFHGSAEAPRNFGITLLALGIGMLAVGIVYHSMFMLGLRKLRHQMTAQGLVHGESLFPVSLTLIVAIFLLGVAVLAITNILLRFGPFE